MDHTRGALECSVTPLAESMTIHVDDNKEGRHSLRYFVVIATCYDMDNDDDTFDLRDPQLYLGGSIRVAADLGYLDFLRLGVFILSMGHVALYALTLRWYVAAVGHKHMKKKSERWICIVLLLGLIEAFLGCLYLGLVNARGTPMLMLNLFLNIATVAKITLAFCLGMCLAQADGMPHPAEGPGPIDTRIQKGRLPFQICVAVYLLAKLIQWWGIYEMKKLGDTTTLDDYCTIRMA